MQRTNIRLAWRKARVLAAAVCLASVPALGQSFYQFHARAVVLEDLTHDTKLVRFRLLNAEGFAFTPGQYTFLKVPDGFVAEWNRRYHTSHGEVSRPYSFASSSSKLPFFELIIKLARAPSGKDVPPGLVSTFIHQRLRVGDIVDFSPPTGELVLRRDTARPIVIIAGGTGAAPFVSLLEYWFENNFDANNEIFLFFGVRSRRDLFLQERFEQWKVTRRKFHYVPALWDPLPGDAWN